MISPRHEAALAYAKAGIPVFPCQVNGKRPATEHGFKDASLNPAVIDAWWAEADYNIGIEPERGGWCVVDIDPRHGGAETWLALCTEHGTDCTKVTKTPSGGSHLYYAGSLPPSVAKLGPGVDTRGVDSYVLAPPSVIDGKEYHDADTGWEITPLPQWIKDRVGKGTAKVREAPGSIELNTDSNLTAYRLWLEQQPPAIEGSANITFYKYGARGRDLGLGPQTTAELIHLINSPGYAVNDIRTYVDNAFKYAQNDPGCDTDDAIFANVVMPPEQPTPANDNLFLSGKDQQELVVGPVEEMITGLVEKRCVTYLSGPGGSNKSRIAAHWGAAIHQGQPVYGRATQFATFVHVSYENGRIEDAWRQQTLVRRLGWQPDDIRDVVYCGWKGRGPLLLISRDARCMETPLWGALRDKMLTLFGHKFIVFDSAYNVFGFEGDAKINETAVQRAIDWLDNQMVALDATGLMLQHPSTAGMARGDNSGWSVAWQNRPRARLSLNPVKDIEGRFELTVTKRNNGPKGKPITLVWDNGIMVPYAATHEGERAYRAVVELAANAADGGVPYNTRSSSIPHDIAAEVERRTERDGLGIRISVKEFQKYLEIAVSRGDLFRRDDHRSKAGYYPIDPTSRNQ